MYNFIMENFENSNYKRKKNDKEKIKRFSKNPKNEDIQKKRKTTANKDIQLEKSKKAYSDLKYDIDLISSTIDEIIKGKKYSIVEADILLNYTAKALAKIFQFNKENLNKAYFPNLKAIDLHAINQGILDFINSANKFNTIDIIDNISQNKKIKDQIGDKIGKTLLKLYKEDIYSGFGIRNTEFIHLSTLVYCLCYTWVIARDLKSNIQFLEINYVKLEDEEIELFNDIFSILSLTTPSESNFEPVDLFPVERKLSEYGKIVFSLSDKDWKEKTEWLIDQLSKIESEKRIFTLKEKEIFDTIMNLLLLDLERVCDVGKSEKLRLAVYDSYFHAFYDHLSGNENGFLENLAKTKRDILSIAYEIDFANLNQKDSKENRE